MKISKKRSRKIKKGIKGAISLFLAVLMTPFLTIATLLVEIGRYNSAVSALDEALGVSAISTLANYDPYLLKRWGLMAMSQDLNLQTTYSDNLDINSGVLGNTLGINSVTTTGMYSLEDQEILAKQILEYSKLNAPTEMALNLLDIEALLNKLKGFEEISDVFSLITSGTGAIDSTITLAESSDKLRELSKELDDAKSDYDTAYTDFSDAVSDLIDALGETRPTDEKEAEKYDDNIEDLREDVDTERDDYVEVVEDIIEDLTAFREEMKKSEEAIKTIQESITNATSTSLDLASKIDDTEEELDKVNKEIERLKNEGFSTNDTYYKEQLEKQSELENQLAEQEMEKGLADASINGLSSAQSGWQAAFASYSDANIGAVIDGFEDLKTKLEDYDEDAVTSTSSKITEADYKSIAIGGYISSEDIDEFIEAQEKELAAGSLKALIDGIMSFFESIFKIQTFYDPDCSAFIDTAFYQKELGGLPGAENGRGGVLAIIEDLGSIISSIQNFAKNLSGLKLIDALKNLKDLISSIKSLLQDLLDFIKGIVTNIVTLFTGYERWYYTAYSVFNLPCRTDKSLPMTNFSISLPQQDLSGVHQIDGLLAIIETIKSAAEGTGDDLTFSGAELEYVMFGSNSEIANQLYAFCAIYLLRLIIDLPFVLTNAEVQSLAAASTFGYPVVMVIIALVEPLIDTILLVNGDDIPLIKGTIFLTPTGMVKLVESLISIVKITSDQEKDLKKGLLDAFDQTEDDYNYQKKLKDYETGGKTGTKDMFSLSYREHCFMITLITVTDQQMIARISNLIQMESLYHYKEAGNSNYFDLGKSYTFLSIDANVSIEQLLPSLADSSWFTVDRELYRGY